MKKSTLFFFWGLLAISLLMIVFVLTLQEKNITGGTKKVAMAEPRDIVWGAYTGNTPASLTDFESKVGKKPNISAVFVNWGEPFPAALAQTPRVNGQTLLIFWEQYDVTLDDIAAGEYDAYILQFKNDALLSGGSIILAPLHEMNGDWTPWSGVAEGNTPEKVVQAFRHIRNVFGRESSVAWAFVVNANSVPNILGNQIEDYYPGGEYVDYVGVDGFNDGNPWMNYQEIFADALSQLSVYKKPIYIFSMGCAQDARKPAWIQDALTHIALDQRIAGWVWFNEDKERDWRVWSSQEALKAFKVSLP